VRHYKTLINAKGLIMGWGDSPRVDDWEADLSVVDRTLKERDVRIDAIYSSFLERSRQTAMYFARQRGISLIHDTPLLNEVNYGTLYLKSKEWVAANIPEYKTDPDFVYPGGESFRQMQRRSVQFLCGIEGHRRGQTILVVVHAGVIRGLICHFLGLDFAANLKRKISHRYVGEITLEGGRCTSYDELGKPSGFIRDGIIAVPHRSEEEAARVRPS
jgi:alpha-ribazole phosphatase